MNRTMIFLAVIYILLMLISAKSTAKDGEIEVKLQFFEYELEDFCLSKNEAEWKFLNGSDPDLKKLLDIELKESEFIKNELEILQKHLAKTFENERLQRLIDIFIHPGAPLLGTTEFKEYRDYSIKLDELIGVMKINFSEDLSGENSQYAVHFNISNDREKLNLINYNTMNKILYNENNQTVLKKIWSKWFEELEKKNKKTKYDFVQQLSILDLEAEQNGEEELADYWLRLLDVTWVNYETTKNLWEEIQPLYNKLKHFMTSLVIQNFNKDILGSNKLIPAHILGTLNSYDWVTAAEKLGAFTNLDSYQEIKSYLSHENVKELYRTADRLTAELKVGYLPQAFYEKSDFNETSETCRTKVTNYCERENTIRIMSCSNDDHTIKKFLDIIETTMKMKYLDLSGKEDEENGYLFREGSRDSVLHEALESFSSLTAIWPVNLQKQKIVTHQSLEKQKILSLIITALHVIPPLPYYLASDLWRINALQELDVTTIETTTTPSTLENLNLSSIVTSNELYDVTKTYDSTNLTIDWWNYRHQFQGITSSDDSLYEDYLQDSYIIWNKPYLSKFLGKILQFQILEVLKAENTTNEVDLAALLRKGKSKPWQILIDEVFNITEISTKPLLKYFKPLEEFLDKGIKFRNDTQIFIIDDFNFAPQSYSFNSRNIEREGERPSESSDALFFSLAVIAAVGVVAIIVTIGRRRYKRRQRARDRKRRLAEL